MSELFVKPLAVTSSRKLLSVTLWPDCDWVCEISLELTAPFPVRVSLEYNHWNADVSAVSSAADADQVNAKRLCVAHVREVHRYFRVIN